MLKFPYQPFLDGDGNGNYETPFLKSLPFNHTTIFLFNISRKKSKIHPF